MPAPAISIIVPSFNAESVIVSCLDSIVCQELAPTEVLVIDGLSTDRTAELVQDYASRYPYIHWFAAADKGVYDAMNKGIALAKGEWLYFLGSDDVLLQPDTLEQVFHKAANQTGGLIYGNVRFRHSGLIYNGPFDLKRILWGGNICHQAIFYHRSVFAKLGGYDLDCPVYADHDFNIRCFMDRSIVTRYIPDIIAIYNETDGLSARQKEDPVFRRKQAAYIAQFNRRPKQRLLGFLRTIKSVLRKILRGTRNRV